MKTTENPKKNNLRKRIMVTCGSITGVAIVGSLICVVVKQQDNIRVLRQIVNKAESDIAILKDVMRGNVIHSLRETCKRKLRYAEGRLIAGIADNVMSLKDIELRKEEIEFFSKQLENLDAAEALLNQ